jgi:hypothetical protein
MGIIKLSSQTPAVSMPVEHTKRQAIQTLLLALALRKEFPIPNAVNREKFNAPY